MSILATLADGLRTGAVEVLDLTAPLSAATPVIQLPPQFAQTATFELEELSRYDDRGPAWYWNNFRTGEHTGTHFDAPVHWVTGRDSEDVASVPAARLVAPAAVLDFSAGGINATGTPAVAAGRMTLGVGAPGDAVVYAFAAKRSLNPPVPPPVRLPPPEQPAERPAVAFAT